MKINEVSLINVFSLLITVCIVLFGDLFAFKVFFGFSIEWIIVFIPVIALLASGAVLSIISLGVRNGRKK